MDYNTLIVLSGTGLLGIASGVIGSYAVLRRRALMGDALAHASLPGICVAYLILGERNLPAMLFGALIAGSVGVLIITLLRHTTRIKEDAAIGMVLSVSFGLGMVLLRNIQNQPSGNRAGLNAYIYGKAASMVRSDVEMISAVCAVVLIVSCLLYKEFKLLSFDRAFAATQGWPTLALDIVMMGLLVTVTVVGLPAVGVVMMAAMLIIPGASARFWTERLGVMLLLAAVFGLMTGVVGTWASAANAALTAGPVIVLVGTAGFVISMLFAPGRGIVARAARYLALRRRTARENVLRTLYELAEQAQPIVPSDQPPTGMTATSPCTIEQLTRLRAWTPAHAHRLLNRCIRDGLVRPAPPDRFTLTPKGLAAAAAVVRKHRLWEMFLIHEANIAADHVDRDADSIEHVLGPETLAHLERLLRQEKRLPEKRDTIASTHDIPNPT